MVAPNYAASLRIPRDHGHPFHGIVGTDSTGTWNDAVESIISLAVSAKRARIGRNADIISVAPLKRG